MVLIIKEKEKKTMLKKLFTPIELNNNFYTLMKNQVKLQDLKDRYIKKRENVLKNAILLNISKK